MRTLPAAASLVLLSTTPSLARGGGQCGETCAMIFTGFFALALSVAAPYFAWAAWTVDAQNHQYPIKARVLCISLACISTVILVSLVMNDQAYMLKAFLVGAAIAAFLIWATQK